MILLAGETWHEPGLQSHDSQYTVHSVKYQWENPIVVADNGYPNKMSGYLINDAASCKQISQT